MECDPKGESPQTERCQAAGIRAFPTWVIGGGQNLEGNRSLEELARASGFPPPPAAAKP